MSAKIADTVKVCEPIRLCMVRGCRSGIAFHLVTSTKKTFSAKELQRQIGHKYYEPIWAMMHKIRTAMGNRDAQYNLSNAKEYDEETGMYYFGARYYDPTKLTFNSRDALFEQKPFFSPYAFCRNNPLRFIDPDGNDEYEFNMWGKLKNVIQNDEKDIIRVKGIFGKERASQTYEKGTVEGYAKVENKTKKEIQLTIKDNSSRESMFEFFANNTRIEWETINGEIGNSERNYIATNRSGDWVGSLDSYINDIIEQGGVVCEHAHNHPSRLLGSRIEGPSGYSISTNGMRDATSANKGDHGFAKHYDKFIFKFKMYDPNNNSYYQYWDGGWKPMGK